MACTSTSGTSMISNVRPSNERGIRRLIDVPNGTGTRARILDARLQDIAPAAHGVQESRLTWVDFDLSAQPYDLHVDRAFAGVVHPKRISDFLARQHFVAFAGERG